MIVVCAGMVRSGSTWAYNAAACLLENETAADVIRDGYHESFKFLTEPDDIENESIWRVLKSHHLDEEAIHRLAYVDPKYIRVLYTYRDVAEGNCSPPRT